MVQETDSRKLKRKLNLLIIDDNSDFIGLISELIENSTWIGKISSVKKLAEAIEFCGKKAVDVVLLDLGLPDSSGMETFLKFKRAHPELAVLVMTGFDDDRTAIKALQAGAQDYFVKGNFQREELIRAIRYAYERKEIEDQVDKERSKIRDYFDLAAVIFLILDSRGNVSLINQTGCDMLGYSQEEIIGQNWVENFVPEQLKTEIKEVFQRIMSGEWATFQKVENEILCRDGTVLKIDWHNTILKDDQGNLSGTLSAGHDITERIKAEQELAEAKAILQTAMDNSQAGIAIADAPDGKLRYVNRAGLMIRGETEKEVVKGIGIDQYVKSWHMLDLDGITPLKDDEVPLAKAMITGEKCSREFIVRRDNNEDRIVWANAAPIRNDQGEVVASMAIFLDITERKNTEKEKEDLAEQIRQTQKMESIGRLAGGVAHDFNNMLCVMLGHGEYLMNQLSPDDPLRKAAEQIVEASKRSADLTQQLLAFSRKQALEPKVINLHKIIKGIDKMLRRLIGEDIEFKINLGKAINLVEVDPGQIEQVIMNLVVNARDAMPDGGRLEIASENVDLKNPTCRDCSPGKYVMLSVTDNGEGIDKDTQLKIFEPFFTTKEGSKGTGLGLATVYGIMRQSNGCVTVESELGKGTTFKVFLPETDAQAELETPVVKEKAKGEGQLIMVVEDEPALRDLLQVLLEEDLGYKIQTAANGGEALLMVEEQGIRPELIITDIVMPGMNGRVLVDRLLKIHPDMKVLFMSGYTQENLTEKDKQFPFIPKPFNISEISEKVAELFMN